MTDPSTTSNIGSANIYALDASDPNSRLIDRAAYPPEIIAQISELMGALGTLRAAEQHLSETAQQAMQLGQTDMQALHFLIVAQHTEVIATPGAIAAQLRISTASTTKLLDRLEAAAIFFAPHIPVTDARWPSPSLSRPTRLRWRPLVGSRPNAFMPRPVSPRPNVMSSLDFYTT